MPTGKLHGCLAPWTACELPLRTCKTEFRLRMTARERCHELNNGIAVSTLAAVMADLQNDQYNRGQSCHSWSR